MSTAAPVDVQIVGEPVNGWDVVASAIGLLGLLVALVAIVITLRQRTEAEQAIARERRTVFELEVLRDLLSRVAGIGGSSNVEQPEIAALIAVLPPEELPLLRRAIWVAQHDPDYSLEGGPYRHAIRAAMQSQRPDLELATPGSRESERQIAQALAAEIRASIESRVSA